MGQCIIFTIDPIKRPRQRFSTINRRHNQRIYRFYSQAIIIISHIIILRTSTTHQPTFSTAQRRYSMFSQYTIKVHLSTHCIRIRFITTFIQLATFRDIQCKASCCRIILSCIIYHITHCI